MKKYVNSPFPFALAAVVLALITLLSFRTRAADSISTPSPSWPFSGQSLANLWSQPAEMAIDRSNVNTLVVKWVFATGGDVSATPTVAGNVVYFPDWAGNLYAVAAETGSLMWSHQISDYNGVAGSVTRVSPAVSGNTLFIGDTQSFSAAHNGANLIAIDRNTGNRLWITEVETHPAALITGSPVVVNGVVYQAISSMEEALASYSNYACCTFRGSVVAVNAASGKKLWQTYDVPDNGGKVGSYSGGAIWQPPAIDTTRELLYIGTGNNYTVPSQVEQCEKYVITHHLNRICTAVNDHADSALALNLQTGAIKWTKKLRGYDVWNAACENPRPGINCPSPEGPDYDLPGAGPNLVGKIVGFGQKSGIYWALNPSTGAIVWSQLVGPGGSIGGIEWGTASDGTHIFVAIADADGKQYTLVPSGQQINWGSWSALDAATGKILWQTADPTQGTMDLSSVSVANGVMYAGSFDATGHMYALNSSTGQILWSYASGGSVIDAPSIVNGVLYWGSGYRKEAPGTGNNKVYAFALPAGN